MAPIILSIGALPVAFEVRSQEMLSRIRQRYGGFTSKAAKTALTIQCTFSKTAASGEDEVTINQTGKTSRHITRSDFDCSIENSSGKASIRRSIYSFDAFIRVLYSILLTENNGLLLHSAGIAQGKSGYLFIGPSGSGKTTLSKLSSGLGTVLNDEIIACRLGEKKGVDIFGTPFWGEMRKGPANNRPCRLKAVCFLNKSNKNFKTALSPRPALNKLLRCSCTFSRDIIDLEKNMGICVSLVNRVPTFNLYFKKDSSFWNSLK